MIQQSFNLREVLRVYNRNEQLFLMLSVLLIQQPQFNFIMHTTSGISNSETRMNNLSFYLHLLIILCVLFTPAHPDPTPIHQRLCGRSLSGSWAIDQFDNPMFPVPKESLGERGSNHTNLFLPFFRTSTGEVESRIYFESQNNEEMETAVLFLQLYEHKYLQDRVVEFRIPLKADTHKSHAQQEGYNQQEDKWILKRHYTTAKLFQGWNFIANFAIELDLELSSKIDLSSGQHLEIKLNSDSLETRISLSVTYYGFGYFLSLSILNLAQIIVLLCFNRDRNVLYSTSEWLLLHGSFFCMFQSFIIGKISLQKFDTHLSLLLINSFLTVIVMFLLLRKFQKVFQKFTNTQMFVKMVIFLIVYMYIALKLWIYSEFWIYESMLFLWQIVYSMVNGGTSAVSNELLALIILSRLPLFYFLLQDGSVIRIPASKSVAIEIFLIMTLHILFICLQARYGSRILIPKFIIPDYFDYVRTDRYDSMIAQEDCPICIVALREPAPGTEAGTETNLETEEDRSQTKIRYVCTPCKHSFHQQCLSEWLAKNLVCPMCKTSLPPISAGIF